MNTGKIEVYGYGMRDDLDIFAYANELMARDSRLYRADALILATALTDTDCSVLYTTDGVLLESMTIQNYIEELEEARERTLAIKEPPLDDPEKRRGNRRKR